ncbi:hypothetical protein TrLO_g12766 [Triparma laevis f. longispina]|uniref:Uncharacterized protein n=1 Tax=Triparma laevis f. longispina TaxID=1714387 RepID=A0A9W7AAR9_9STRA|nr:hypothetical protein TrLO_g12766 [Triparma laevis f. longispina]
MRTSSKSGWFRSCCAIQKKKRGNKVPVTTTGLPPFLSRKASMTLGIPLPMDTPRDVAVDDDRPPSPVDPLFLAQCGRPNHPQKLPCTLCGFKGDGYTCHGCGEGRDYLLCEECVEKNCCCVQFYF